MNANNIVILGYTSHDIYNTLFILCYTVKFSETPNEIRLPPPLLGQHTEEVLTDLLGYDADKLKALHAKGTIKLNTI
jgi:crotonobetainyl-CoA:carnitine CoA-transferase CaiB-like acyl-CoA transferase